MQSSIYGVNRINQREVSSYLVKPAKVNNTQSQEKVKLRHSIEEKLLTIVNDKPKAFSQNHSSNREMLQTRTKQSFSSSSINQKKSKEEGGARRKSTMIEQLKEKRKKFLDQYGYIKNKYEDRQDSGSPQIRVVPNIQYMNQGFLSSFQEMKVQKQMKQYMMKKKTLKMTKQKEGLMKKKIKQKEEQQIKNSPPKTDKFSKIIQDIHAIDRNQIYKNLNIEKLSTSMIKSANRIYGKKYDTGSVAWCANIMNSQYMVETGEKSENQAQKFQWQAKSKRRHLPSNQHIVNKLMFRFQQDELSSTIV